MNTVKGVGFVTYLKQGAPGKGIQRVTEYYLASSKSSGVGIDDAGWQATTVPSLSEDLKYLWNYEEKTFTDGDITNTEPHIIGVFAKDGVGISYIVNWYLVTDKTTGVNPYVPGWTTDAVSPTPENRYLWNYEHIQYTNGLYERTEPHIIGVYGEQGLPGEDGVGIAGMTDYYLLHDSGTGITINSKGWTTQVLTPTPQLRFLWNYVRTEYTDGTYDNSQPHVACVYGEAGADGSPGPYVPIPRYWNEYPAGYRFQCGDPGEERKDVVLYKHTDGKIYYLACKTSHQKQAYYEPFGANSSQVWETGQQWTFIATNLLLAQLARIENLCAEYIQMLDDYGNVIFEAINGNVTCNKGTFKNVDVYGRIVAGDPNGKRIVVDPDSKAVIIYDDSGNECARLDGSSYTSSSVLSSGGSSLTLTYSGAQSIYAYGSTNYEATGSKTFTSKSGSTTVGALRVIASASISMSGYSQSGVNVPTMVPRGSLYCLVKTYNSSGSLINTERVLMTSTVENTNGTISSPSVSRSFLVSVPAGQHQVSFELVASGSTATATVTLSSASFVADSFMARYFKNGLALVQNTANYLVALCESGLMKLMLGGDFLINNVKQPKVVYAARVTDSSTDSKVACTTNVLTCIPGYSVSAVKQSTEGHYKLTFPAAYGLTAGNVKAELTGYGVVAQGGSRASKATVKSYSVSGGSMTIEVLVSDDDSPNYGGFEITVMKY